MKKLIISLFIALSATAFASTNAKDYIFAVVEKNDELLVFINTKTHWEENHSLIDSYESEEADTFVNDSMNSIGLCNSMESTFEPCKRAFPKKEYVKALKAKGFVHNIEFEKWIANEI